MEVKLTINAPELAHALETLAIAIGCTCDKLSAAGQPLGQIIKEAAYQVANTANDPISISTNETIPQVVLNAPVPEQSGQYVQPQQYQEPQLMPIQPQPASIAPTVQMQAPVQTVPSMPVQQSVPIQQAPPAVQQVTNVPVTEQSYTIDQLAVASTSLMDAGKRTDLINLLNQFGVQALTALPKAQYGAFATALRAMGAKI